jgi:L-aspartate oxidase
LSKDALKTGASDWAQGGIAAAIDPADSPQLHLEDTLRAGAGLCDPQAVEFLVENAAPAIQSLLNLGVAFDRRGDRLAMTLEAAHSRSRVLHAADTTGRAIVSTLREKVLGRPNIQPLSEAIALKLWIDAETGHCQGISYLHRHKIRWLKAGAVILATGGGGQVFAQTTNPAVSTGDGVALAWRAGAIMRDLEFVQFHPTALTKPGAPHFLISEAVRGEGAHLIDERGNRFVFQYHPSGELAPRDVVSRAIFTHLQKTSDDLAHARVYLDLRPIEAGRIRRRFPNIIRVCQKWGVDVFSQPIPVVPAAHYWMGGIATDLASQTSIPGLYAIGEAASTGVHGANRLASNSLLECIVFAAELSHLHLETKMIEAEPEAEISLSDSWTTEMEAIAQIRSSLPVLVWESAGICRSHESLETAIIQVQKWREELRALKVSRYIIELQPRQNVVLKESMAQKQLKTCAETLNLLDIAYLILKSALFRTESRGGHYRTDYPDTSPNWQVHTLVRAQRWWTAPISYFKVSK